MVQKEQLKKAVADHDNCVKIFASLCCMGGMPKRDRYKFYYEMRKMVYGINDLVGDVSYKNDIEIWFKTVRSYIEKGRMVDNGLFKEIEDNYFKIAFEPYHDEIMAIFAEESEKADIDKLPVIRDAEGRKIDPVTLM